MNHRQRKKMLWTTDYRRRFDVLYRLELRNQRLAGKVNKRTPHRGKTHIYFLLGPENTYKVQPRSHRGFIGECATPEGA